MLKNNNTSLSFRLSSHNDYLPLTPNNLYLTLGEFLKAWINIICYERQLYPRELFSTNTVTLFGIVIPVSRHPAVLAWQDELIANLLENLIGTQERTSFNRILTQNNESGFTRDGKIEFLGAKAVINRIKNVSLIIFEHQKNEAGELDEQNKKPIERFVMDLSGLKIVNSEYLDKEFEPDELLNWESIYEEIKALIYDILTKLRSLLFSRTRPSTKLTGEDVTSGSTFDSSAFGIPKTNSDRDSIKDCARKELNTELLSYDIFLETDKMLNITNYDKETKWVLDVDDVVDTARLVLNSSMETTRDKYHDASQAKRENKVLIQSYRSVEIGLLNFHCHSEKKMVFPS